MIDDDDKKASGSRRLSAAQWEEIVTLWELGEGSLDEISKKYGISPSALSQGLRARGVTKGSRSKELAAKIAARAEDAHVEAIVTFSTERQKRIEETKLQHYEWSSVIGKLVMKSLATAQQERRSFASEMHNLKALRIASSALAEVRAERYALLNAEQEVDESTLPELVIRGLTEDERQDILNTQNMSDDFDFKDVKVEVDGLTGFDDKS